MSVTCLSFHADYRCRHSGACCTAGWPIPVEPAQRARLDAALASGSFQLDDSARCGGRSSDRPSSPLFVEGETLPDGSSILRLSPAGACSCYDAAARRCRIHAQLGHDALPAACQHFPRVCLIDRDGASVTLSHYCPTAARMLVGPAETRLGVPPGSSGIAIVEASPSFAPMALEGLDARDALPPLLRPGMLADRESYRQWEREVLAVLDADEQPETAMARIADATGKVREWEPRHGPLGGAVARAFEVSRARRVPATETTLPGAVLQFDALVRECVPEGLAAPAPPASPLDVDTVLVAPRWSSFSTPVRRYLAAKAFASWVAYQGRGLRTVAASLAAALSVLRVEAIRHAAAAGRPLDEALLIEALRSADLLLVHLASREELARRLSEVEEA